MRELRAYTEEELAEQQQLYDEVFTPAWEGEGQYCRAGGGQYEKSFAWWAYKHRQTEVEKAQAQTLSALKTSEQNAELVKELLRERDELQKRVDKALFDMNQRKLELRERCDGYKDPVGGCQSEGVEMAIQLLEQALKGEGCQ